MYTCRRSSEVFCALSMRISVLKKGISIADNLPLRGRLPAVLTTHSTPQWMVCPASCTGGGSKVYPPSFSTRYWSRLQGLTGLPITKPMGAAAFETACHPEHLGPRISTKPSPRMSPGLSACPAILRFGYRVGSCLRSLSSMIYWKCAVRHGPTSGCNRLLSTSLACGFAVAASNGIHPSTYIRFSIMVY